MIIKSIGEFVQQGEKVLYPIGRKHSQEIGGTKICYKQCEKNLISKTIEKADGTKIIGEYTKTDADKYIIQTTTVKNKIGTIVTKFLHLKDQRIAKNTIVNLADEGPNSFVLHFRDGLVNFYRGDNEKIKALKTTAEKLFKTNFNKVLGKRN